MTLHDDLADARANRAGVWVFIIAGAAIIAATLASATLRILALVGGSPVTFSADLVNSELPLDNVNTLTASSAVSASTARTSSITFVLDSVPAAVLAPAVIQQAVLAITTCTVIVCLILLARNTLRGRIFSSGNTKLVAAAGFSGLVGFALAPAIGGIASHEAAFAAGLTDSLTPSLFAVDPFPFIIAAFAISIVLSAFALGDRLQRDQEGLI